MSEHRLAAEDAGRTVEVAAGDRVVVALDEQGGSGYTWLVEALPRGAGAPAERYEAAGGGAPGAASRHVFELAPPGEGRLALVHRRPWEGDAAALERFEVTLVTSA